MLLSWPEDVLGTPPSAWVQYAASELVDGDASLKLDAADALLNEFAANLSYRERVKDALVTGIEAALAELAALEGTPPAPVANAVGRLSEALERYQRGGLS